MAEDSSANSYVVVARRYRPQSFEDLVGQSQVAQALTNAIKTGRVGHAYLFAGARGVGKTSTARIFAKALNCEKGPTPTPCNECDICLSISTGEDVDVLEIDGASNRGIDEIRQLRSNVNVRPSRERHKIYIIDEVHMLTAAAFNALLKTLEEPPKHVKFIFCTTDPDKIPITVLSRCQRFDFAPAPLEAIHDRLAYIAENEGVKAAPEALRMLARRANGSMRDSQSLLEQLLSFAGETITVQDVHRLLGTAASGRMASLVERLAERDAAGTLQAVDQAAAEGVEMGQLAEQLLGHFRDMAAAVVGCNEEMMRHTAPSEFAHIKESGAQLGLQTILAVMQILDQTLVRLRHSTHSRTLLEMAVVRICCLENLDELSTLVAQLQVEPPAAQKKNRAGSPAVSETAPAANAAAPSATVKDPPRPPSAQLSQDTRQPPETEAPLPAEEAESIWRRARSLLTGLTADLAAHAESIAISAPNRLVLRFREKYTLSREKCEGLQRRKEIERAVWETTGRKVKVEFETLPDLAEPTENKRPRHVSRQARLRKIQSHPFVQEAVRLFDGDAAPLE